MDYGTEMNGCWVNQWIVGKRRGENFTPHGIGMGTEYFECITMVYFYIVHSQYNRMLECSKDMPCLRALLEPR